MNKVGGAKTVLPLLKEVAKSRKAAGGRRGAGRIIKSGDARVKVVLHLMILVKCSVRLTAVMKPPAVPPSKHLPSLL